MNIHQYQIRQFPADQLDDEVVAIAQRVAKVSPDLQALNKRVVHRQMDAMGMRAGIRAGCRGAGSARHAASDWPRPPRRR